MSSSSTSNLIRAGSIANGGGVRGQGSWKGFTRLCTTYLGTQWGTGEEHEVSGVSIISKNGVFFYKSSYLRFKFFIKRGSFFFL